MFDPTAQEPDTPIVLRPSDFTLLAGAAVCAITVPTNRDGYPTGAALLLSMLVGPNSRHPGGHWHSYLLPELPDLPLAHFAGIVRTAVDMATDPATIADGTAKAIAHFAHEAATADPALAPTCPGPCRRKLFGPMADRGACLDCFPKAPPDSVLDAAVPLAAR